MEIRAVAPLAGAWIEISMLIPLFFNIWVAPLAGAWIEILCESLSNRRIRSLPSRERGLKCFLRFFRDVVALVAPLAGAWIEIRSNLAIKLYPKFRRSPRGSVD